MLYSMWIKEFLIKKESSNMKYEESLKMISETEPKVIKLEGEEALKRVRQDEYSYRYVKDQPEAVCLEAFKQPGYAIRYVKEAD